MLLIHFDFILIGFYNFLSIVWSLYQLIDTHLIDKYFADEQQTSDRLSVFHITKKIFTHSLHWIWLTLVLAQWKVVQ